MDVTTLTQFLSMTTFQPASIGEDADIKNIVANINRNFTIMTLLFYVHILAGQTLKTKDSQLYGDLSLFV